MKKPILITLLLFVIGSMVKAQSGHKIAVSIGPELSIPFNTGSQDIGSAKDYYQDGIGGSIKVELPLTARLHLTGSAGYVHYGTNEYYVYLADPTINTVPGYMPTGPQPPPYEFIPLKVGLQYYLLKCFYVDGEAGEAIKVSETSLSSFIYSAGTGVAIPFGKHSAIDAGVRIERGYKVAHYDYAMSQVGFRVAYKYRF